jgi:hypothetical protein
MCNELGFEHRNTTVQESSAAARQAGAVPTPAVQKGSDKHSRHLFISPLNRRKTL